MNEAEHNNTQQRYERQAWYLLSELEMRNTLGHYDDSRAHQPHVCYHGRPRTECPHHE